MPDLLRVACVQMTSRDDKAANLERAEQLVARAAATGADIVVLPEKWNAIGKVEVVESRSGAPPPLIPAGFEARRPGLSRRTSSDECVPCIAVAASGRNQVFTY